MVPNFIFRSTLKLILQESVTVVVKIIKLDVNCNQQYFNTYHSSTPVQPIKPNRRSKSDRNQPSVERQKSVRIEENQILTPRSGPSVWQVEPRFLILRGSIPVYDDDEVRLRLYNNQNYDSFNAVPDRSPRNSAK